MRQQGCPMSLKLLLRVFRAKLQWLRTRRGSSMDCSPIQRVTVDWKMQDVLDEEIMTINKLVRPDENVNCALSRVVDSTIAAILVHKATGDRLHCVFVDNDTNNKYQA